MSVIPLGHDTPPLPPTRLLQGQYVFDRDTRQDCEAALEIASLLDVYLYWREALALVCTRQAALN